MDTGKAEEVTISQVFEVGTEIAERSDNDPVLSVVRELFFYKLYGDEWEKEHPQRERAGTQVLYKKLPYTLIHTNSQTAKAMIEDAAGNIQVVPYEVREKRPRGRRTVDLIHKVRTSTPDNGFGSPPEAKSVRNTQPSSN